MRVAHVAFEFGLWHKCRDGVHYNNVHAAGADQRFRDFQRLFAVIRLRHQQVVHVHSELPCVHRIERVLRINERCLSAELLRLGDHMQRHRRLAAGFRAVNLDHAPAREPAHAQRGVNRQASAGNHTDWHQNIPAAQAHDRALAVVFFNLRYRRCQQFFFFICHFTPRWRKLETLACPPWAGLRGRWPGFRTGKAHRPCPGT